MKHLAGFFVLICCMAGIASCSDMIWDIAPISLHIYVNDGDGKNLLEDGDGMLDVEKITASYKGGIYGVQMDEPGTKAIMPQFSGLVLTRDSYGNALLTFGELGGEDDIDNEDIVISWGDGSSDTITVFNRCKYKVNGDPSLTRRFYVNGKKTGSDIAKFVFVK